MRITKKLLRETKSSMRKRITELCAIIETGGIKKELQRCYPIYLSQPTPDSDVECLRILLTDLLELAIPSHWHE